LNNLIRSFYALLADSQRQMTSFRALQCLHAALIEWACHRRPPPPYWTGTMCTSTAQGTRWFERRVCSPCRD